MDEVVKVIILIGILILSAVSAYCQYKKKKLVAIIWGIICTVTLGILVNYVSPFVIAFLPNIDPPVMPSYADSQNDSSMIHQKHQI